MAFFSFQMQAQEDALWATQETLDIKNVFHPPLSTLEETSQAVWKLQSQTIQGPIQGTGFFIAPKLLITNFHVILHSLAYVDLKDIRLTHKTIPGILKINKIKALSAELDLALLEIDSPSDTYLRIKTEPISEMEDLFLLGYNYNTSSFHYIKKTGYLKKTDPYNYFSVNYFNLAGASGGPILSTEGQVTGVASMTMHNFLISLNREALKDFIDEDTGIRCSNPDPEMCIQSAIAVIYKKAEQGDPVAQYHLSMQLNMIGVTSNYEEIIYWLNLAAEQNHLPAINNLAGMYYNGIGVEQNYDKALYWLNLAAEQNFPPAIHQVAKAYRDGKGVEQSDTKAVQLFERAVEQNHLPAIDNLAVMYTHGRGVEQSDTKAFQLFKKAANQGFAKAQYNLGIMYLKSRGVEYNRDQALYWLNLAAEQNFPLAINVLLQIHLLNPSE